MNKDELKAYCDEIQEALDEANERLSEMKWFADNTDEENMKQSGCLPLAESITKAVNETYKLAIKLEGKLEP